MKKITLFMIAVVISAGAQSQNEDQDSLKRKRIEYYFQFQSGMLIGCGSCSDGKQITFSGSTTHGIKIGKRVRVGAGVGLDSYFERNTIPVFGSVGWDLIGKKNALYVELNYGGALASWRPMNLQEYGFQKSNTGKVYSYAVGYRIKYDKMRISMGVGRKTQLVTTHYEYPTYYWNFDNYIMGEPSRKIVKSEMNRLMIYLAVGWK
jgi:hypothetical protein